MYTEFKSSIRQKGLANNHKVFSFIYTVPTSQSGFDNKRDSFRSSLRAYPPIINQRFTLSSLIIRVEDITLKMCPVTPQVFSSLLIHLLSCPLEFRAIPFNIWITFRAEDVQSTEVQKGSLWEKPDPLSYNCPK